MRAREKSLHLRLSAQELSDLRSAAAKAGVNVQTFLVASIYGRTLKELPTEEYLECCKALREISESMVKITTIAEKKEFIDIPKYWQSVREVQRLAGKLVREEQG